MSVENEIKDNFISVRSIWDKKEGLKEIITSPLFVPQMPIGRKEFFLGFLVLAAFGSLFGALSYLFFDESGIRVWIGGVLSLALSYVVATWFTKRFIDIRPKTNAKLVQIVLFVLFLIVGILASIQEVLLNEVKTAILSGSLDISENTFFVLTAVSVLYAVLGLPFSFFTFYLFFKKGCGINVSEKRVEIWNIIQKGKKKILSHKKYVLAVVAVAFVAAILFWQYAATQKREVSCLQRTEYMGNSGYYIMRDYEGKIMRSGGGKVLAFGTQDEAMRFC